MKICRFIFLFALVFTTSRCAKEVVQSSTLAVYNVSPMNGLAGTVVTINGANFSTNSSSNKVSFNGTSATVNESTATQLKVVAPSNATTGAVNVKVGSQSADGPIFVFTSTPTDGLAIISVSPLSGAVGTEVTIVGFNFNSSVSGNAVTFNGVTATVKSATTTQLVVVVPNNASTGVISVTNGTLQADGPSFEYIENPIVNNITPLSGSQDMVLSILGSNFSPDPTKNIVTFPGGISASVLSASTSSLTVKVPKGTQSGPIDVKIGSTTAQTPSFQYIPTYTMITVAGSIGANGLHDGPGATALFCRPMGIAIDGSNNIYVADSQNQRIRKIAPDGTVSTLAGSGPATCDGMTLGSLVDGPGTTARFNGPNAIALDGSGNLFVSDQANAALRKVLPTGDVSTLAGNGTQGYAEGTGSVARFNNPNGVAVDFSGNIYVADYGNFRIRQVTQAGVVSTFAGNGTQGFIEGPRLSAEFNAPAAICSATNGDFYISDAGNNRIRRISNMGTEVSTAAGTGQPGITDGIGSQSSFFYPIGVATNNANEIFAIDNSLHVRKIVLDPSNQFSTVTTLNSSVNGMPTPLMLQHQPLGIAVVGSTVYLTCGNAVVKLVLE